MIIDIAFAVLLLLACIKGYSKGLIVALFSILAFIAGLAAAMKLSSYVALRLSASTGGSSKWLPFLSFFLVFVAVVFVVNLGGRLIQKSVQLLLLGWANRIGGILLYALLYTILLSIFLFYAVQLKFLSTETVSSSSMYPFIRPIGPCVIDSLGTFIPFFKGLFTSLQDFFGKIPTRGTSN
jgi:membrane protein required for colicin V production